MTLHGSTLLAGPVPPLCDRCNGRTRPARRGRLGSGGLRVPRGALSPCASLSERFRRTLLRHGRFDGDSVSPGRGFVKRGKQRFSPGFDKSQNACYNFGETPQGTASGQLRYPERGCFYADYFDLSREGIHRDDHCKTQKPPLGKVTVSWLLLSLPH